MKKTVVTCVTAILCVIAVCVSSVLGTSKLADAKVEAAKYAPSGSVNTVSGGASYADNLDSDVPADVPADSDVPADTATDGQDATAANGSTSTDTDTPASTGSTGTSSSGTSASSGTASSKPSSTAEILNYFNTAVNKVKTSSKGGVKNYEKNTQAGTFTLTGPFKSFSGVINGLVEKNMGEKKGHTNLKLSKADIKTYFPVENETWSSKLTTSNISSATLAEKNGKYVITVQVKPDASSTNTTHGTGNHGKAFNIVQVSTILENAGPLKSMLEGNVKIGYHNGKIVATIDPKTGNLTHINYYYVWDLDVTVAGSNVKAPFGIESDFTINW